MMNSTATTGTTVSSENVTGATTSPTTLQGSTSTTPRDYTSTTTASSKNETEATTSATSSPTTMPGSSTTSYTKPHPAVKTEENGTIAGSEATAAYDQNSIPQAQNSSSCPIETADGASKVAQGERILRHVSIPYQSGLRSELLWMCTGRMGRSTASFNPLPIGA